MNIILGIIGGIVVSFVGFLFLKSASFLIVISLGKGKSSEIAKLLEDIDGIWKSFFITQVLQVNFRPNTTVSSALENMTFIKVALYFIIGLLFLFVGIFIGRDLVAISNLEFKALEVVLIIILYLNYAIDLVNFIKKIRSHEYLSK